MLTNYEGVGSQEFQMQLHTTRTYEVGYIIMHLGNKFVQWLLRQNNQGTHLDSLCAVKLSSV